MYFVYSGALTKGDRRAATGAEFSEFNFDTAYGRSALRQMYNSLRTVSLASFYAEFCAFSVETCVRVFLINPRRACATRVTVLGS